jgi:hypothetical protein
MKEMNQLSANYFFLLLAKYYIYKNKKKEQDIFEYILELHTNKMSYHGRKKHVKRGW